MSSNNSILCRDLANRLAECGVPDPKFMTPDAVEELRKSAEVIIRGALLRIDRIESSGNFLRVETRLGNESNLFYIKL